MEKSTQSRRNGSGRAGTNVSKKTGKNAPIVVHNAWAALQEDTTSEEDEDDDGADDDEDEEEAIQVQPEPEPEPEREPDRASGQEQASVVHLGRSGDPKVQQLMDLGATGQEAKAALEQANGDIEAAAEIFFGSWENRLASLGTWEASSD